MKPHDLLKKYLLDDVAPVIEPLGFKFSPSQMNFSRKVQGRRQYFHFALSKWNYENHCTFWTIWNVTSRSYAEWHKKEWGQLPVIDALGGDCDWNLPGWQYRQDRYFHLRHASADKGEIECLLKNILQVGIPYLERISTWEGAAEKMVEDRLSYHRAADFLMIAGNPERAQAILLEGVKNYEEFRHSDNFGDLPRIKARLAKYF